MLNACKCMALYGERLGTMKYLSAPCRNVQSGKCVVQYYVVFNKNVRCMV